MGYVVLGGTSQDYSNGAWVRVERDLQADINARFPGKTLQKITGIYIWTGPGIPVPALYLDDLSFSNSLTVEHNTLGGGVIGHILRNRTINPTTLVATDRWFHYDQVGSVMSVSNGSGVLVTKVDQDAFGNVMASWQTGLWTDTYAARAGWHHNTKEFDADAGMVYMYQRWYQPEVGVFATPAPFHPMVEHQSAFVESRPQSAYDPSGRFLIGGIVLLFAEVYSTTCAAITTGHIYQTINGMRGSDKLKHCLLSCELTKTCGAMGAFNAGWGKEAIDLVTPGDASLADTRANALGRRFGQNKCRDCYDQCIDAGDRGLFVD